MNENLMIEYVYAIKDYTQENDSTIIGAFDNLSDAEEMILSLTEEAVHFNALEMCHRLFPRWKNIEEVCQKAWRYEFFVWSYWIEAIPMFYY